MESLMELCSCPVHSAWGKSDQVLHLGPVLVRFYPLRSSRGDGSVPFCTGIALRCAPISAFSVSAFCLGLADFSISAFDLIGRSRHSAARPIRLSELLTHKNRVAPCALRDRFLFSAFYVSCLDLVGSSRCNDLARVQRAKRIVWEGANTNVRSAPGTARGHRSAPSLPTSEFGLKALIHARCSLSLPGRPDLMRGDSFWMGAIGSNSIR